MVIVQPNKRHPTSAGETPRPLIHLQHFIQSIREAGYQGTAWTVAELVDNSIQADAKTVRIAISAKGRLDEEKAYIAVLDDGLGMTPAELQTALQIGGTLRFESREGIGRFGMGLPCSSLSRARRLTVSTWRSPGKVISCYLDLDDIIHGRMRAVPRPEPSALPESFRSAVGPSGTLVVWTECDRLEVVRPSTLAEHLSAHLGRIYRHFLLKGRSILLNGQPIRPVDPLFVHPEALHPGGQPYGEPLVYEVAVPGARRTSRVEVRFSELPVREWHALPNDEKRRMGIIKGAGVSVVRADREIDYGWFFTGAKRRENYDDWWRCEVRFKPELDEVFGVTFTKQGIRPDEYIAAILTPDIEKTARKLNARVRQRFMSAKPHVEQTPAEAAATRADRFLTPPPSLADDRVRRRLGRIKVDGIEKRYSIVVRSLKGPAFFEPFLVDRKLVVVLNSDHPFYEKVYRLFGSSVQLPAGLQKGIELLLLSAARAESCADRRESVRLGKLRVDWSNTLAAFLGE